MEETKELPDHNTNPVPHKPEDIDPETGLSYQVKEWLAKYPEAKDTLSLSLEERKRFVGMYYADQQFYEEKLEQMLEESENIIDTELELYVLISIPIPISHIFLIFSI